MLKELSFKALHLVLVAVLVTTGTFVLMTWFPGDPAVAILGADSTDAQREAFRIRVGLDGTAFEQFSAWAAGIFHGDLGVSFNPPHRSVSSLIAQRLPITASIAVLAILISITIAIPAGVLSAAREDSATDKLVTGLSFAVISLPSFVLGLVIILLLVFNLQATARVGAGLCLLAALVTGSALLRRIRQGERDGLRPGAAAILLLLGMAALLWHVPQNLFPRQGIARWSAGPAEVLRHIFLPALTLGLIEAAVLTRLLRSDMVGTLHADFIASARAKGLPGWRILMVDALRPSLFSVLTVAGLALGSLLGGTVIVETMFNIPGLGHLLIESILTGDFRVVQGIVLLMCLMYVAVNTLVDLLYVMVDPRLRVSS